MNLAEYEQEIQMSLNQTKIPERMRPGIMNYVMEGVEPGGFLMSVFSSDLMEAYSRADAENQQVVGEYVMFCLNHVPFPAIGSRQKTQNWIKRGGLRGANDR